MVKMYFTMLPLILAGIANMLFTKTELYRIHRNPIDGGRVMSDRKRIFGNNKTWIGFFSMIFFCIFFQLAFGLFCKFTNLNGHCDVYLVHENTISFNLIFGSLTGFIYMLSELPNSFVKRRLSIQDGKTERGFKGLFFFVFDQIDSLIGVMFLVYLFSNITLVKYVLYVFLGGLTHLVINILLYLIKVRKNV